MSEPEELEEHAMDTALEDDSRKRFIRAFAPDDEPPPPQVAEYAAFVAASQLLRDSELAYRKATEAYREALNALTRAVAPIPA